MRLTRRGVWWRRGLLVALLAVAVVTTTGAALGPMYARASAESILQDHLEQATWRAGLQMRADLDVGRPGAYQRFEHRVLKPGAIRGYRTAVPGFYTPAALDVATEPDAGKLKTHLVWVAGQCRHLVILQGRCPQRANEAIISQRAAAVAFGGSKVGTTLYPGSIPNPNDVYYGSFAQGDPVPPPLKLVGVYRPRSVTDPFWFGQDYFDQHAALANQPEDTVDSLFVAAGEFTSQPPRTVVEADFYYPLTPSDVRLDNLTAQRAAIARVLSRDPLTKNLYAESGLSGVLDAAAHEKHLVDVATLLVTLQLTLLAWLVLFQVAADAIAARGNEIAMAKLRGHSPAATVRFGLAEPMLVLLAAVPIGIGLAIAITHAFADAVFVPGVPVELTSAPVLTALVAFAGGLTAAFAGGYRTFRRPVLDQWRGTTRRAGHGWLVLALDLALAAAAAVGLVALLSDRHAGRENDTAALLAPGLLVFAVAIVGVRLVPLGCRWLAARTRAGRQVGTFLAARQVARRPAGLRLAAFLAVAAGLATFAVAGESVAASNRTRRAQAETGAPRVATVQFDPGTDPVTATHRADPRGRWAMAAATWLPDGGGSIVGTVLGVDAPRLAAVVYPGVTRTSVSRLAADLTPPVPPVRITGSQVRVHLTASDLTGNVAPDVQLNVRTPDQPAVNAEGSAIGDGSRDYVVRVPCNSGCVLRGITWDRPVTAHGRLAGTITLAGLDVRRGAQWQPLALGLHFARSWYSAPASGQASDQVTVGPAGVRDTFANVNGGYGGIAYASDPNPMPAVASPGGIGGAALTTGRGRMMDASNTTVGFQVERTVPVLPAVLGSGLIMNVSTLQDEQPAFTGEANWQVCAVVLGVPTGLLAARLALPAIPEFATSTPVSLHYEPQLLPTAVFVLAFVVLLVATAAAAGLALIRAAVPSRLRVAE